MFTGDFLKALEYINLALEEAPGAYYMHFVKANIEKQLGDLEAAKKTAQQCFDVAVSAGSHDYQRLAKDFISKN
jgi:Tfp pilus assembly protein PilF